MTETRHELLTEQEESDLREIDALLHEANEHSLAEDSHCKSSDGHVSVSFGNHWERHPDSPRKPVSVEIYSYLLGPHRSHHFDTTAQALDIVRQWHRREMSSGVWQEPDAYLALESERRRELEESMRRFEEEMGDDGFSRFEGESEELDHQGF